jgi:uncharacterized protein (DUF1810 family)
MTGDRGARADPFDLKRFLLAQEPVFASALNELREGQKRSHWMWFVFPQLRGLGSSPMAELYRIGSLAEARAYLDHPLLGRRLLLCTETVLATGGKSLHEIFGSPDDMKFRSSMTLFVLASGDQTNVFCRTLAARCEARLDDRTLTLLKAGGN